MEAKFRHWRRVEWLFLEALSHPPEERAAFVRQACPQMPEDRVILEEVESLLAADERAGEFLASPMLCSYLDCPPNPTAMFNVPEASASGGFVPVQTVAVGNRIGRYQVLGELGEGGMSTVYLACRPDLPGPFRVAMKLAKAGTFVDRVDHYFHREYQILASLRHPHIAKFLDSGSTEDGRPYFVMEYVEGVTIDRYCAMHGLSIERRLMLFLDVCSAVQYAHRNLIVHRDLKPSNILVTAEGVPKLLDFGIAKLFDPSSTPDQLDRTAASQCFWTPHYASPEQILGRRVTTATDVYSLAMLLFKLLTGKRPYCLEGLSPQDIERVICESEPPRPSAIVDRANRTRLPVRLRRRLKGDLDTIILMALRKEPERRYCSVKDFSDDLGRYLNGRPVLARKNTPVYRTSKFVRRHSVGVAASIVVCLSLVGGAVTSMWQARRVLEESRVAEAQRVKAERVSTFIVALFKIADPAEALGEKVTAREILDRGASQIRQQLQGEPEVRATLMDTMGVVYTNLGLYKSGERLLKEGEEERRRVLGANHPQVAESLAHLASLRFAQFAPREAVDLSREAVAIQLRAFGPEDPRTVESLQTLANALQLTDSPEVEEILHRVLAIRRKTRPEDDPATAETLGALAWWLTTRDRYAEAEPIYAKVLSIQRRKLGVDHEATLETLGNLATLRLLQGRYPEAEELFRQSLSGWRRVKGTDHPQVGGFETGVALALCAMGRLKEAEVLHRQALSRRRVQWGDDHPAIDNSLHYLGAVLYRQGRYAEAEIFFRQALSMRVNRWGEGHRSVANTLVNLAQVKLARGDARGAEKMFERGLSKWRDLLGEEHPGVAEAMEGLARSFAAQGRVDSARQLFQQALKIRKKVQGPRHPDVATTLAGLGHLWISIDPARAEPLLREALDIRRASYGDVHWETAESKVALGECLWRFGQVREAAVLIQGGYRSLRVTLGDKHPLTLEAFASVHRLR